MESKRLTIRPLTEEDAPFLFKLMNTEKWFRYIGDRNIADKISALTYIRSKMSPDLNEKGFVNHVMIEKKSGKKVGTCSLHNRDGIDGLDIGYALLPEFEGLGYATEGASMMSKMAFQDFKQQRINAITTAENTGSCGVLEKLGFHHDSIITLPGSQEELKLYVLDAKDLEIRETSMNQ